MKPTKQLQETLRLLKIEKEADFEQYRQYVQQLPLPERVTKGLSWYPLDVKRRGFTYGERAYVIVERTKQQGEPHRFRGGMPVSLFSRAVTARQPEARGVIQYVDKDRMKIVLSAKDTPDWLTDGSLGVDLLFDERTYREMETALKRVIEARGSRLAELRDILLGEQSPDFYPLPDLDHLGSLNESQLDAVRHIVAAKDLAVVHGPPGTGKTTTLVQAVRQLVQRENTVLVTAPSNTAVDVLAERLTAAELSVVRIGNISRVDESLVRLTLDHRLSTHPDAKQVKKIKQQAAEMRKQARKYRRNFGGQERRERREAFREAGELETWSRQIENRMTQEILDRADVIACTLVNTQHSVLEHIKFRTMVMDEAGQALEPAAWIPIARVSKVVLCGDPLQLPPTVKSHKAAKGGLSTSLIEKAIAHHPESVQLLATQYRMHEQIMGFSNGQFYHNQLRAADLVRTLRLPVTDNAPLIYIDTAGCGFSEQLNPKTKSRYNPEEFFVLREHLLRLLQQLPESYPASIAVLSPYQAQVSYMREALQEDAILPDTASRGSTMSSDDPVVVSTIDGFQGQEREVVLLSLVRANDKHTLGFLKDYRRMNVAMTRAQRQLVVVGDSATLAGDAFFDDFLAYAEQVGGYRSAWEYMQPGA